jgi:hypothetical protein
MSTANERVERRYYERLDEELFGDRHCCGCDCGSWRHSCPDSRPAHWPIPFSSEESV